MRGATIVAQIIGRFGPCPAERKLCAVELGQCRRIGVDRRLQVLGTGQTVPAMAPEAGISVLCNSTPNDWACDSVAIRAAEGSKKSNVDRYN